MRRVDSDAEMEPAYRDASSEAERSFGSADGYVEKLLLKPRHIEIQVLGDGRGKALHIGERDCSLQRRHQKIVEESPSPALTPALRARMGEAAVAAARAAGYRNAGTIEFLVEGDGDSTRFYFLEMNTRLQVEHPVTEAVTGTDLVRAQLAVAAGDPLPWTQKSLAQRGHAIECRVYAEDPSNDFLPQAGPLRVYREPSGPGIRVDSGVAEAGNVSIHYDPLLAKLIAFAETREAAIERALLALGSYQISGIRTNIPFLVRLLQHPAVRSGAVHTQFVQEHLAELVTPEESAEPREPKEPKEPTAQSDPWSTLAGWRVGAGEQRQRSIAPRPATRNRPASHPGTLMAPMPATVVRIQTEIGKQVARGDTLLILEAMKMELPVRATSDGTVRAINCAEGDLVQPGVALIEMA